MRVLDKELIDRKINYDYLEEYGFILNNNKYIYEKYIMDNEFKVIVMINKDKVSSKLIEVDYDDEYLMADVDNVSGEYIGKIKDEYNRVINDIIDKCTSKNVFKSGSAIKVIKYIKDKYGDDLEYLWEKFPKVAIWRNKNNNKWYGLLMVLEESKLGIDSNKEVDIIDIRYDKDKVNEVIDNKIVFPGYHMNKKSWITIKLDNDIDINKVYKLIDNSYKISLEK